MINYSLITGQIYIFPLIEKINTLSFLLSFKNIAIKCIYYRQAFKKVGHLRDYGHDFSQSAFVRDSSLLSY